MGIYFESGEIDTNREILSRMTAEDIIDTIGISAADLVTATASWFADHGTDHVIDALQIDSDELVELLDEHICQYTDANGTIKAD